MHTGAIREIFEIIDREFLDLWRHNYKSDKDEDIAFIQQQQEMSKRALCAYIDAAAGRAVTLVKDETIRDLFL